LNIAKVAIERNRTTFALVIFLLLSGLLAFFNMPRAKDPDFAMRTALLVTPFPGATPERIESLITIPLEEKIRQLSEIKHVRSRSMNGVSIMRIDVKDQYDNVTDVWNEVRRKIKYVTLPDGAGKPEISEEYNAVYGTLISITGEGFSYAELEEIAKDVKSEFLQVQDVGQIALLGLQKQRIYIEFSNAKLSEIGLSPSQLGNILKQRNIITPGGEIAIGSRMLSLEPTGNLNSIEELKKTIIPIPGTRNVLFLEDIVDVKLGYSDPKDPIIRTNNREAIVIGISLALGGNIIDLGDGIKERINHLLELYPIGIEFNIAFDEPEVVDTIISDFVNSLLLAIGIVSLIMFLTLGWRTGIIVATLIPSAILTSLFVMDGMGIGFHQVSLAALIIALGMLVDNAIVMSESISVHMQEGSKPINAAIKSVNELKVSLLTSTITTAAAFLPIYLADSVASEYTSALFEVVSITLLCSWVLALTLTPLLSFMFLRPDNGPQFSYNNPFCNKFKSVLIHSLKYRYQAMVLVLIIFVMMLGVFKFVPRNFFPPSDQTSFLVKIELPAGTKIEKTLEVSKQLEKYINGNERISSYTNFIGKGAPRFWINNSPHSEASNYAELLINTQASEDVDILGNEIVEYASKTFYDAQISIQRLDNGPPQKQALQIRIGGNDLNKLLDFSEDVIQELQTIDGIKNIHDDWGTWSQKLIVNINPSLAYHAGVSYSDIARSLQIALSGQEVTQFRGETKTIPIIMRSGHAIKEDYDRLESTLVFVASTGRSVPLRQVANIEMVWKPPLIVRRDGMHTITLTGELTKGITAFDVKNIMDPWLKQVDWGIGYHYEFGGAIESSKSSQEAIQDKLPVAAMIILLVLIVQFNSIKRTGIILITIPLGIIGVIAGLVITNSSFGFMSYLGVISLTGIVINNAIILIERIEFEIKETGLSKQDAIIEATQRRMRPIVLTTATTIGGLIPLWLGGGSMWAPMAIAIIFGLLFSTILTLGVVPILYALFFQISYKKDYKFIYGESCILDLSRGGAIEDSEEETKKIVTPKKELKKNVSTQKSIINEDLPKNEKNDNIVKKESKVEEKKIEEKKEIQKKEPELSLKERIQKKIDEKKIEKQEEEQSKKETQVNFSTLKEAFSQPTSSNAKEEKKETPSKQKPVEHATQQPTMAPKKVNPNLFKPKSIKKEEPTTTVEDVVKDKKVEPSRLTKEQQRIEDLQKII
jgi:multidrug efflux pump